MVVGDHVKAGDVIADGPSTDMGELALGRNVLVAFMPWGGYNFEDSILISERVVKDDFFTSIHIEEFECVARDTKLGPEEITRDIPNVGDEALKDLDESGIIRIGAEVKPGDILVGKITPKGETQLSPEEKLLRAIFGEKAGEVRDTSLARAAGRRGHRHQRARLLAQGHPEGRALARRSRTKRSRSSRKDQQDEIRIIRESTQKKVQTLLRRQDDQRAPHRRHAARCCCSKGVEITPELLEQIPSQLLGRHQGRRREGRGRAVARGRGACTSRSTLIKTLFDDKIERLKGGDELPPGVIKMVKVFVAIKRKLQVGDKMAGRHGNKGVLSRILPEEDMPYLADGTPVDIVLNPLGVPSPHERRPDPRDASRVGGARARRARSSSELEENGRPDAASCARR